MKKILFCIAIVLLVLFSCKPEEQPHTISYVFSDVSVDSGQTSATVTCRNESVDDDKVHASVLLSKNENITDVTKYSLHLQNDTLRTTINGLEENTMYYFCFEVYTANEHKRTEEVHHFQTTGNEGNVTVTTSEAINVTQTTAIGGGNVSVNGNYTVGMRGVCWDTVPNPNALQSPHSLSGEGTGSFMVNITGLSSGTTYYMRAYAVCNDVPYYGNEVSFVTLLTNSYSIGVSANPSEGGTATGDGIYYQGQSCTVIATAANGYRFTNWTEDGNEVSTNANYTFTVNNNRALVANFSLQVPNTYIINASPNPSNGGTVTGGGSYEQGQNCTLTATANTGYTFLQWTENENQVSTNANYTFTVTGNRTLIAQFQSQPQVPTGAINGLYSVSATKQVYFSQGNLQYQASTHTWRHAENQWDYVGVDNANVSETYSGWMDLFGWGTSGYSHGAVCYQPWSTSENDENYHPYGSYTDNLFDQTGQADWGYNAISNGGNTTNSWRTLKKEEWDYVLFHRNTVSGIRFAKAIVNGVNGVVLVPDSWSASTYALNAANNIDVGYCNTISSQDWTNILQPSGAVFLPASGSRYGSLVYNYGAVGVYWTSSRTSSNNAYYLLFNGSSYNGLSIGNEQIHHGNSVRLVRDAE